GPVREGVAVSSAWHQSECGAGDGAADIRAADAKVGTRPARRGLKGRKCHCGSPSGECKTNSPAPAPGDDDVAAPRAPRHNQQARCSPAGRYSMRRLSTVWHTRCTAAGTCALLLVAAGCGPAAAPTPAPESSAPTAST